MNMNNRFFNFTLLIFIIFAFILSLMVGRAHLSVSELLNNSDAARIIIQEVRLPRTIIALLCGGALGLGGAVLQGLLRNPLADPGVLGISAVSSLGAVIAIYFGLSSIAFWILPAFAICFAIIAMALLLIVAKKGGGTIIFILTGIILATIANGLLSLALTFAPNPFAAAEIIDWQIGSFSSTSNRELIICAPFIIIGVIILFQTGRGLDALMLGEDTAFTLGINIKKLQIQIIIGVGLMVGAACAISGVIAFIGLIIPHIIRIFIGNKPSEILVPSFLFGAIFTLLADIFVRSLWLQHELKLGIIMTLIGAPFFLLLLINQRNKF